MMHLLGFLIAVLTSAVNADSPIPQNAERQQQHRREQLEWHQRLLTGNYEKVGKKNPSWDQPAREALDAIARHMSRESGSIPPLEEFRTASGKAIMAGCDDPLILWLAARFAAPGESDVDKRLTAALEAMRGSAYSPLCQMMALATAGLEKTTSKDLSAEQRQVATKLLDDALALLSKSVDQDELNLDTEKAWFDQCVQILNGHRALSGDYKASFDKIDAELARHPKLKALRHKFTGFFMIGWGWEARGTTVAALVPEEGGKNFVLRLLEARKALQAAWDENPNDPRVASLMVAVETAIGNSREEMEKWFERAMNADPDHHDACRIKLQWLEPKWHGNYEDMMAFGRACRDTKNYRSGIPLLVVEAHRCMMQFQKPDVRTQYYKSREVWDDIHTVYGRYLKLYPNADAERSKFAIYCALCGRNVDSDRQFTMLGDRFVYPAEFGKEWVNSARKFVKEQAEPINKARERLLGASACVAVGPDKDHLTSAGTAALIDEKQRLLVISNRAIPEKEQVYVYFPMYRKTELVSDWASYVKEGSVVPGKVITRAPKQDLALIQIDEIPPQITPLQLATAETQLAQRIHILGSAPKSPFIWGAGTGRVHVLNQGKPPMPGENAADVPELDVKYFEIATVTSTGRFAAPVINDGGELVGVTTAFGAAIDVSEISKLIEVLRK